MLGHDLSQLVHHSDRGVQYLSIRYSERLAENAIVASVGSKGDSYDNAMAEAFNSLYKWELIYPQGPWRGVSCSSGAPTPSASPAITMANPVNCAAARSPRTRRCSGAPIANTPKPMPSPSIQPGDAQAMRVLHTPITVSAAPSHEPAHTNHSTQLGSKRKRSTQRRSTARG